MGKSVYGLVVLTVLLGICSSQRLKFKDVSAKVGLQGRDWLNPWRPEFNRYWGSTIFDANGDGIYDMVLVNHSDETEFYFGQKDGTYKYRRTYTLQRDVHSSAACDWDGDGDEDFVAIRGGRAGQRPNPPEVFIMDGPNLKFEKVSPGRIKLGGGIRGRASAFFDVDGDGDKDLMLINRHEDGKNKAHFIYENRGNSNMVKRSNIGLEESKVAWFCLVNLNNDNFLDVLLMGFEFVEVWMGNGSFKYKRQDWRLPGAKDLRAVRGCAEMDVDNDGTMEIFLVRGDSTSAEDDKLYKVRGGQMRSITKSWGVPKGGKHSHITNLDVDNDGRMDAYVSVMTYYKGPRKRDLLLYNTGSKFKLINLGNTGLHIPYNGKEDGDNAVAFDYNNDGLTDVLVGARNAPWRLYENQTRNGAKWIRIAVGRPRPGIKRANWFKDPWGALVRVQCRNKKFVQRTGTPGMSHSVSNLLRITFGLGNCNFVNRVRIHYIGGVHTARWIGSVNREVTIGLMNCPGKKCDRNIKKCETRCKTGLCEQSTYFGTKLNCPV